MGYRQSRPEDAICGYLELPCRKPFRIEQFEIHESVGKFFVFLRLACIANFLTVLQSSAAHAQFRPLQWTTIARPVPDSFSAQAQRSPTSPAIGNPAVSPTELEPITPLTVTRKPWPAPSLNPGVPSAFIANWGDVFIAGIAATAGNLRDDPDGSWTAGFGLGDAARSVALEFNGGCGSIKQFCSNGGLGLRVSRLLVKRADALLALSGSWRNIVQWSNEGQQDNIYSASLSYAMPLRPIRSDFTQTLQFNAGVGNSTFAPYTAINSESRVGGFASVGVELLPSLGVSTGWSGRGANAQLSYTPFRQTPLTLNLLGTDLFNQTPSGTVAVFSLSWGSNYLTPNFR